MAIDIVPPLIGAQLNYLVTHSPLPIKVEQMWSGSKHNGLLDRFTLAIPFCLDYIRWDVIYNALYPLAAPDIIFGPEDEGFRPYPPVSEEGDLKSPKNGLSDWNCKDPTRLLSLILELRELYMTYQKKRVGEVDDERVKFEISTIVPREGIEMYMGTGIEKTEEVKFAVPLLDMDINKMVTGCPWRHQQKIYLQIRWWVQVIFPIGRKYVPAPSAPRLKLVSSPELKALFSIEDFRLPAWLEGMCMAEYLPTLEEMLQSQVHFSLPLQFPKQQPALILQSSQNLQILIYYDCCGYSNILLVLHFNSHGAPIKSPILTEFPWSPRWESSEMAERMYDFLVEECLNFKKFCNESMLQQR
ncbi:hypothetical protein TEA_018493 [Camellia sinensis var. sinensis]|uniref:BRISC and BRCA1-A complex member 2 n=1 Tax=Camellia sinensis var. sinensis TaxID=542762 RepID=A0A4S4E722_CAMSN|nr:hypothetical protein TEA_018493 [Camellia sinensis var. sinensis]